MKKGILIAPSFDENFLSVLESLNRELSKDLLGVEMTVKNHQDASSSKQLMEKRKI